MPHIHEKIDFAVETFIVHADKVFLRLHDKYNIWLTPGGHVELDEDPNETAVREAKEEAGLDIVLAGPKLQFDDMPSDARVLFAPRYMARHHTNADHEHVVMVYFATSASDVIAPAPGETVTKWHWFTAADLDDPQYGVRGDIRHYAHEALRELGTKS